MAMLAFSAVGFFSLYGLERLQNLLPLNPQRLRPGRARPRLQHGDQLRHQHQLAELCRRDHHEPSRADARAHGPQLRLRRDRARDRARGGPGLRALGKPRRSATSGPTSPARCSTCCCRWPSWSPWCMVALGVPQTLLGSVDATTLEGAKQVLSMGPMASQEAIKELGTNGGGFFNANSAHPFENPNIWSNLLEIWSLLVDPGRDRLHLRPAGRRPAPGPGHPGHHGDRAARRRRDPLRRRDLRQSAADRARRRPRAGQHGGQGGPLRPGDDARSSRPPRPAPAPAPSTPCTIR